MTRIRLALEWFLNPDHVPFLVARHRGWFAEEGLEVELVEPSEHEDAMSALMEGTVDVAITEPIHLVQDVAAGSEVRGFARFLHTNGGVMVLARSGIERPRDLAGRRIQYPGAPGPGGLAIVSTMIEADGGTAEGLVPVNRGFHHTDALAEDAADAATLAFWNFEVVEARHRGLEPRLFALKDWGIPDFCQLILIARPAVLATRQPELRGLLRGLRRGIDAIKQEPEACRAVWFEQTGTDPKDPLMGAIYDATLPCFTHDLDLSATYLARLAAWLHESGQSQAAPDPTTVWTSELVHP
jgi:putative hydroxymethylpyrimidine transport system substrate-binding protein